MNYDDNPVETNTHISTIDIENRIISLRGTQVILDRDLAMLYKVDVAQMNRQVKRNIQRFPEDFMFQLTKEEYATIKPLTCQNGILDESARGAHTKYMPYAFTEQGVSMLSGLLRSETAIHANIQIMRAFVAMRRFLAANANVFRRLDILDQKLMETEHKLNTVLDRLEDGTLKPKCGIFFDGQTFDAYVLISDLIRSAKNNVILIDNYVDESVLTMLDKRNNGVMAIIYTMQLTKQFKLDLQKHDIQYPSIPVKILKNSHDRFLIIDNDVFHVGASLKDLGKKWFAIMKMEDKDGTEILSRLQL